MKKLSLFMACIMMACLLCGCSGSDDQKNITEDFPVINIGSDIYPPYVFNDANGKPTGIDVELAEEAFKRMGYKAVFKIINWEEKTELVDSGEIDCIWGSFSKDGREDQYNWSEPYMVSRQVIAVRKDSDITNLSDLKGKRVAVQSTTKPEGMFLSGTDPRIPDVLELISLQKREVMYPYLSKGYVDAIAGHEVSILTCMSDYKLDYRILDEPLDVVGIGVAFSKKDNRKLEDKLSKVFAEMRDDGTMKKIIGKYLSEPEKYMETGSNE